MTKKTNTNKAGKDTVVTFTTVTTARGNKYEIPSQHANLPSVSAMIRAMIADGWTKYQISKVCGIRYQMVRNILLNAPKT